MTITILNYQNVKKEVEVGELKDIRSMTVSVVTGDEILNVTYKDGTEKRFDSCEVGDRTKDFFDGEYVLYDTTTEPEINELENEEWKNRDNYSYLNEYGDTSNADDWNMSDVLFGW